VYCTECGTENQDGSLKCNNCKTSLVLLDTPLHGGDRVKIIIFCLLLAGTIFFGVIPLLLTAISIYIMKKDKSFTPIINSKKYIKAYLIFLALGATVYLSVLVYYEKVANPIVVASAGLILTPLVVALLMWLFNMLYFRHMEEHRGWVIQNGIFSDKKTADEKDKATTGIIGRDNLSSFSIADELLKWSGLLEKNLITQEEFDNAKQKILKK